MPRTSRKNANYHCESLESRQYFAGTWARLTNALPSGDGAQIMLLLGDGTVMIHGGAGNASANWYKLTPNNGNYATGTFSALSPMGTARLYTGSAVLPSGKVFVVGGEYSGPSGSANFSNTAETYDPVTNTWTPSAAFPKSAFGDDPVSMLPNGTVLGGYISGSQTYIYNPANDAWAATGSKLRSDRSDEESWVKLADDSILSYDVFSTLSTGIPRAQRYLPSTGQWVDAGTLPASLCDSDEGDELGPGYLLPDGRAFFVGANGNTAYYTPSTNSWAAGPVIPNSLVGSDDPGATLPNGKLLVAVSPEEVNDNFPGPTTVYELNPTTNTYTDVTPSLSGFSMNGNAFTMCMLDLPTGQILFSNDSGRIGIYTPDGAPNDAWRPQIKNITSAGAGTYTLSGTTLNGISEGAYYGDDNQMASNYPIIRLVDSAGNIKYARAFNWTSTSVAMGVSSSVSFTLPSGSTPGPYLVSVAGSGISSPSILAVLTTAASTTLQAGAGTSTTAVVINGITAGTFSMSSFVGVIVAGDTSANTIDINQDLAGRPLTINADGGSDIVHLNANGGVTIINTDDSNDEIDIANSSHTLASVTGAVTINGGTGNDTINLFDNSTTAVEAYTFAGGVITRSGFGGLTYSPDVESLTLTTGTAADSVAITSLPAGTAVSIDSAGGKDAISVGSTTATGLQGILSTLSITNSAALSTVVVNDNGDNSPRSAIVNVSGVIESITGIAPATIQFTAAAIQLLTLRSGASADTINVSRNAAALSLTSNGGIDIINLGNSSAAGVQGITGSITVSNGPSVSTLNVNDTGDSVARTVTVDSTTFSSTFSGVAPATIIFAPGDIQTATLTTGSGNDTVNILRSVSPLTVASAGGNETITIGGVAGTGIEGITATLTLSNSTGTTTLTINDTGDASPRTAFLSTTALTGMTAASIFWDSAVTSLTVFAGDANDTVSLIATRPNAITMLSGGNGTDTLNINGADPTDPAIILPSAGDDTININTDNSGAASAAFNSSQRIGALSIGNGGTAKLAPGGAVLLTFTSISLNTAAHLDIADDAMIWDYTGSSPQNTARTLIGSGFNVGAWTGPGISSSIAAADPKLLHAVGYADAGDLGISTFHGQSVDTTSLLIAYTRYGDNNLDGVVDIGNDYSLFIDGFSQHASTWELGDYTFDGTIDLGNDFNLFDRSFLAQP